MTDHCEKPTALTLSVVSRLIELEQIEMAKRVPENRRQLSRFKAAA